MDVPAFRRKLTVDLDLKALEIKSTAGSHVVLVVL